MNGNDKKQRINKSKQRWRIKEKEKCDSGNQDAIKRLHLRRQRNRRNQQIKRTQIKLRLWKLLDMKDNNQLDCHEKEELEGILIQQSKQQEQSNRWKKNNLKKQWKK